LVGWHEGTSGSALDYPAGRPAHLGPDARGPRVPAEPDAVAAR